jgi:hypothetical protein
MLLTDVLFTPVQLTGLICARPGYPDPKSANQPSSDLAIEPGQPQFRCLPTWPQLD